MTLAVTSKVWTRTATTGAGAFEYPEVEARMWSMLEESVDRQIVEQGGQPFGVFCRQRSEPFEYDAFDDETGEYVHVGPLVNIWIDRQFWPDAVEGLA